MFWKINYVVDDGHSIHCRVCIINEKSKERAIKVFNTQIKEVLKGERFVRDEFTEVTLCDNDVLIYDGSC